MYWVQMLSGVLRTRRNHFNMASNLKKVLIEGIGVREKGLDVRNGQGKEKSMRRGMGREGDKRREGMKSKMEDRGWRMEEREGGQQGTLASSGRMESSSPSKYCDSEATSK